MEILGSPDTISVVSMLKIGPLRLWTPIILAPMAGVTNMPFRRLCRLAGEAGLSREQIQNLSSARRGVDAPAGLYVSEMITSRALVEGTKQTLQMITADPQERVRSVQLYGVDPHTMGAAAKILIQRECADHIDLNFGCPVPKVTRRGGGAALPWKRDLFQSIVRAVVKNAGDIPVTVKMRLGIDDDHRTDLDAARLAQSEGAQAVTLHARTAAQHYSGQARWDQIARLKEFLQIPLLGNGDIFAGVDAPQMMAQTGCDGVVVGRGCQGRPWLFTDLVSALNGENQMVRPTLAKVCEYILKHTDLMVDYMGSDERALCEMRKHIGWYLRGFAVGGNLRGQLAMVATRDELQELLGQLDQSQLFPAAGDGPRGRAGRAKKPHLPQGWLDSPNIDATAKEFLSLAELDVSGG